VVTNSLRLRRFTPARPETLVTASGGQRE